MRSATITFHASHNFGSMLQAYALQQTLREMGCENKIIDFRSPQQRRIMRVLTLRPSGRAVLKDLTHLAHYHVLKRRHEAFECFIREEMGCTREYREEKELERNAPEADIYIAGSDQIWNTRPSDFSIEYTLPFARGKKKIAYGASFGPNGLDFSSPLLGEMRQNISEFDYVGAREEGSARDLGRLCPGKEVSLVPDPVFLLDNARWQELQVKPTGLPEHYIFFYTLFADREMMRMVKELERLTLLPVVVANFTNAHDLFNPFIKRYATGPREFLGLLYGAEMVVTSSFHGTAFSAIARKPLLSLRASGDNRRAEALRRLGMESCSVEGTEDVARALEQSADHLPQLEGKLAAWAQEGKIFLRQAING